MDLLYFTLCAYGMTYILLYGSIFNAIRPTTGQLGQLFKCPLCMGWWVGVFLFGINDLTELFSFSYNLANAFLLGCLASGTTYFISMLVNDFGLKIRLTGDIRNEKK